MEHVRILIVDDHQAVRRGLRSLISTRGDWSICGEAGDGREAIERARELRPDVVLMDVSMPRMGGIEATRELTREMPESKVIIISQNDPAIMRQQAREASAKAFISKADLARDLLPKIEEIVIGNGRETGNGSSAPAKPCLPPSAAQLNAERVRLLFDSSSIGIAALTLEGEILEANEAFCAISGYSQRELRRMNYAGLLHGDDRERLRRQMKRLADQDIPSFVMDQRFTGKSGRTVSVQSSVCLTRDETGVPLNIVAILQEFTEPKHLMTQLRESEQRFREMVDAVPLPIYTTDPEGRLTHFNPAAIDFAGYVPEIGSAKWCVSYKTFHADGRPMPLDQCPMAVALREGRILEGVEAIAERPDGSRIWFTPFPRVMRDANGAVTGGVNMLLDITERKQIERTTGLLAAIVDSSDDAIVSKRLDGTIMSWNKSAERLFGYKAEEAVGRHISLIIPPDRLDEEVSIIDRISRGVRVDHFETVRRRKDGSLVDISVTISPVRDSSGAVAGASKVARDITERKRTETALAQSAREQAALFTFADQLHRATSEESIYAAGLDAIFAAFQCDRAAILLTDDSGAMHFVSWRGLSDVYRKMTEGLSPWTPNETNPQPICMERASESDLGDSIKAVAKAEGITALAFIPLLCSDKLMGKFMTCFDGPHNFTDGECGLSMTIARQIAFSIDRKRADEALRASEERFRTLSCTLDAEVQSRTKELEERNAELIWRSDQLRELSRRMIRVQDDERRHIARELHDSAGQTLTVLGLSLAALMNKLAPELKKEAEDSQSIVQQLSQEIRTTSYLLHPPLLDEAGLVDALQWFIDGLLSRSNLEIGLLIAEDFGRLPTELELVIFRLVQECLTNIHRHSGSKSATIRIARKPESVVLQVEDYGKGIPAEKLAQIQSAASGVGIRGMTERIRQFDGEMNIKSDSSGTTISVTLPLATSTSHGEKEEHAPHKAD